MKKETSIHITKHAKERIIERVQNQMFEEFVKIVFRDGKELEKKEYVKMIAGHFNGENKRRGFFKKRFIKFRGFLWIFHGTYEDTKRIGYNLITVISIK